MIKIDSEKEEIEVSGDVLTLSSELGYLIGELKLSGVPIQVLASSVMSFLMIRCNKDERQKFVESLKDVLDNFKKFEK